MTHDETPASAGLLMVRVFGGMGIDAADGPVSIGGPQQRRLLALLTLRAGSVASIDWLAEHLWADDDRPEATAPAIRTYMSRLRQALPEAAQGWLSTESAGYLFDAPSAALEHRRFVDLRAQARSARGRGDPLAAMQLLDDALGLWRGEPFQELEDSEVASATIEQLKLDRLEVLEERWESALALGRHTQITGELAVFSAEHRLRDRATRQYALALHRSGRTPEALRVIASHREYVADESGLDPSSEVLELEQAMLVDDESLAVEKVGRPLRGYRLLDEIGAGAFSIVWRGMQPSVGREVAIKQIRSELASQPEFIRRFEAEAHLVARIEHPHIVPLVDYWRDPDSAYLVMRYLRGGTLERRLDDGELTVDETLTLAHQIGGALTAAHNYGIVHRDVKTGNILFDEVGNAYLADFGIALEETRSAGPEAALSPGSPAYASPEQIKRLQLGAEADVFSLGVVLFECLAGSLPFADSASVEQLLERQLNDPYPALSDLRPDIPVHVSDAIAKATAKEPGDRWSAVEAFLDALAAGSPDGLAEKGRSAPLVASDTTNPYKGLLAFDDADIDNFFGRERLVTDLVNRLAGDSIQSRSLLVVGPSGSGKSSVVRAGLIPAIRSGAIPGCSDWFITTMVPGADPYESLEAALLRVAVNPPTSLLAQLEDGDRGIVRAARRCLTSDDQRVLLVIDQLEEIFTNTDPARANQFLAALAAAVEDPTSPLLLVATLRADYYHRPLAHPTFARVVRDTAVDVTPLAADELERAIVEPARRYGVEFEPGLPARIAAESLGQTAPLPLLQYALAELFERRQDDHLTTAAYEETGGLGGALAARAESLHETATEPDRAAIRRLFGRLTNPSERTADLRRRVPLSDLASDPGAQTVLDIFGTARLITFDRDVATREPTAEVAHEALFREWPRLARWLDEDADMLRSVEAVSNAATTWDDGGRSSADLYRGGRLEGAVDLGLRAPEHLRDVDSDFVDASRIAADMERAAESGNVRRLRRLVVAVGVGLVLALVAGGIAFWQQRSAADQARRAEDQTELAEANAVEAQQQTELAAEQARRAEEQAELAEANATEAQNQAALAVAATGEAQLANLASQSAAQTADNPQVSLLLALEVHRRAPSTESEQVVLNALGSSALPTRLSTVPLLWDTAGEPCNGRHDLTQDFAIRGGNLVSRDLLTGVVTSHGPTPELPCVQWSGSEQNDLRWAHSLDGLRWWVGPWQGTWSNTFEFESPWFAFFSGAPTRRLSVTSSRVRENGSTTAAVLDLELGEIIGEPFTAGGTSLGTTRQRDGSVAAVSFGELGQPGDGASILIVDISTGQVLHRVAVDGAATAMDIDEAANQLIANISPRTLVTIDLETGEIAAEVDVPGGAAVSALSVRPDGRIMVVTSAGVEWHDRVSGQVDEPLALAGLDSAWIRADGTVLVFEGSAGTISIIDIEGSAMVDRSLRINPFGLTVFNDGFAAVVPFNRDSNEVDLINLATGESSVTALVTRDGDPFVTIGVYPEIDGILAVDRSNLWARWVGTEEVDRLQFDGEPTNAGRMGEWLAVLSLRADGSQVAALVRVGASLEEVFTVDVSGAQVVHPTAPGGMHVVDADGRLRTYDIDGTLIVDLMTPMTSPQAITVDPTTGVVAASFGPFGADAVGLFDPETEQTDTLPVGGAVTSLGFARQGELLAITTKDGTTRLWDLERNASGGLIWRDTGADNAISSWYDDESESLWLATGGKLVKVSLNPQRWIERACELAARDLTQDEWDRYVPDGGTVQSACVD